MATSDTPGPEHDGTTTAGAAPAAGDTPTSGTSSSRVETTRAWTGLMAVVAADTAIAVAAILGIVHFSGNGTANSQLVAILSSAFTAIGTTTTAYFGIKSMSNTAKNLMGPPTGDAAGLVRRRDH